MTRYVYVIQYEPRLVKVGLATDPRRRLSQLRPDEPRHIFLAGMWAHPFADRVERLAHEMLAPHRTTREWFAVTADDAAAVVVKALAAVPTVAPVPMAPAHYLDDAIYTDRPGRPSVWTPERQAKARELMAGGMNKTRTAQAINVSTTTLMKWLRAERENRRGE